MAGGRGKDKMVAGLLAILLGALGIHHFYLGSTTSGIILLVVTLISCGILGGICWIIGLVEGIMIFMMSDADFDSRYNARTPEPMEFVFMPKK